MGAVTTEELQAILFDCRYVVYYFTAFVVLTILLRYSLRDSVRFFGHCHPITVTCAHTQTTECSEFSRQCNVSEVLNIHLNY